MVFQSEAVQPGVCILRSPWSDPARNLAVEEYLLDHPVGKSESPKYLLLYENRLSVVFGKNQNPWMEASPEVLKVPSGILFRRISGGGTVYNGPGNLNFSFILPRRDFSKEDNLDLVRRAIKRLGIDLERTERGDLLIGGRKVSGNALCYRKDRVIHHGTLLVSADLEQLRCSLSRPAGEENSRITTRAVASAPSPVANLTEFLPDLTTMAAAEAIAEEAALTWGDSGTALDLNDLVPEETLARIRMRNESWDWVFGMTPPFSWKISPRNEAVLHMKAGRVERTEGLNGREKDYIGQTFQLSLVDAIKESLVQTGEDAKEEETNGNS